MSERILTWVIILGVAVGSLYAFESMRLPCRQPLSYSIGEFDSRFGITESEFRSALSRAERPWESVLGRDLFRHEPTGAFPVNLIFDERQERTIDGRKLETEWDTVQSKQLTLKEQYDAYVAELAKKRAAYDALMRTFERSLTRYNERVAEWNQSDRTDEDELDWLRREERRLKRAESDLESLRSQVNALITLVNRSAKEEEKIVEHYNAKLADFTESYGTEEVFDQGIYEGESIDIYQFDDVDHLDMVLTHELGHALGIGHVENAKSVMYPVMGEQDVRNIVLSAEDRAALVEVCSVTAWDLSLRDIRAAVRILTGNEA